MSLSKSSQWNIIKSNPAKELHTVTKLLVAIPRMQNWFHNWKSINLITHLNRIKTKTIWSSQQMERYIWQSPTSLYDKKKKNNLGIEGNLIWQRSSPRKWAANITYNSERLNAFPQKQEKDVCSCHFYSILYWGFFQGN